MQAESQKIPHSKRYKSFISGASCDKKMCTVLLAIPVIKKHMFHTVLRIRDVYTGSNFFYPVSRAKRFRYRINKLKYFLTKKLFLIWKLVWDVHPGSWIRIFSIPDPESRCQKSSGFAKLHTDTCYQKNTCSTETKKQQKIYWNTNDLQR